MKAAGDGAILEADLCLHSITLWITQSHWKLTTTAFATYYFPPMLVPCACTCRPITRWNFIRSAYLWTISHVNGFFRSRNIGTLYFLFLRCCCRGIFVVGSQFYGAEVTETIKHQILTTLKYFFLSHSIRTVFPSSVFRKTYKAKKYPVTTAGRSALFECSFHSCD